MQIWYEDGTNSRHVVEAVKKHTVVAGDVTASEVDLEFENIKSIDAVINAEVRSSAGLQRTGFVVTVSGVTVTVADNGTTTELAAGDVITLHVVGSTTF